MRVKCVMVSFWLQFVLAPLTQAQTGESSLVVNLSEVSVYGKGDNNAFAWLANTAVLGQTRAWNAGVFALRKYMLPGLGEYQVSGSFPIISGAIGVHLGYSGSSYLNTAEAGLGYGRSLGSRVWLGAGFDYRQTSIRMYGGQGYLYARTGFLFALSAKVFATAQLILPATNSNPGDPPRQFATSTGLGYVLSPQASFALSIKKVGGLKPSFHGSILYQPLPSVHLRAGMVTGQPASWLSAGWQFNKLRCEITGYYHYRLGLSPGISFHLNQSMLKE